jgi:hypothetical protein
MQDLGERLVAVETQMKRFISDVESEKDTRRRSNTAIFERFDQFDERMRRMERMIWTAAGATGIVVSVVVFLANTLIHHQ